MGKFVAYVVETESLTLSEQSDGFWLWDKTRQMNLAMCAKTPFEAFTDALTYYQSRLTRIETDYRELSVRVDAFVSQFREMNHG